MLSGGSGARVVGDPPAADVLIWAACRPGSVQAVEGGEDL
jgi:hypothetical protein